jgi:hypothetical protein
MTTSGESRWGRGREVRRLGEETEESLELASVEMSSRELPLIPRVWGGRGREVPLRGEQPKLTWDVIHEPQGARGGGGRELEWMEIDDLVPWEGERLVPKTTPSQLDTKGRVVQGIGEPHEVLEILSQEAKEGRWEATGEEKRARPLHDSEGEEVTAVQSLWGECVGRVAEMSSQGDLSVLESEEIGKRRQTGSSVREESEGLQAPREEELTGAGVSLADPFLILCGMERRCRRGSAMEKFVEEC